MHCAGITMNFTRFAGNNAGCGNALTTGPNPLTDGGFGAGTCCFICRRSDDGSASCSTRIAGVRSCFPALGVDAGLCDHSRGLRGHRAGASPSAKHNDIQGVRMKTGLVLGLVAVFVGTAAHAAQPATGPKTDKQKFSYAVGFQIGQNLKRQKLEVDPKTFSQGAQDALAGTNPRLKPEEMQAAIQAEQQKEIAKQQAQAQKNLEAGQAFLEANKKKPGVVTLPSGLQYKVITAGNGKQPKLTDTVVVHYRGTLINGTEFDSSYKRNEPVTFPVDGVIKGWQEVLPLMKEGAKWEVYIPSELAYGPRGAGNAIGPNEVLIFEIELLSVKPEAQDKATDKGAN
jgi:FKBP-type peptidyl-prolyl cis-trans isomerase FklB